MSSNCKIDLTGDCSDLMEVQINFELQTSEHFRGAGGEAQKFTLNI